MAKRRMFVGMDVHKASIDLSLAEEERHGEGRYGEGRYYRSSRANPAVRITVTANGMTSRQTLAWSSSRCRWVSCPMIRRPTWQR